MKKFIKFTFAALLLAGVVGVVEAPQASAEDEIKPPVVTTTSDPGGGGRLEP